jgi:hypothetical protein
MVLLQEDERLRNFDALLRSTAPTSRPALDGAILQGADVVQRKLTEDQRKSIAALFEAQQGDPDFIEQLRKAAEEDKGRRMDEAVQFSLERMKAKGIRETTLEQVRGIFREHGPGLATSAASGVLRTARPFAEAASAFPVGGPAGAIFAGAGSAVMMASENKPLTTDPASILGELSPVLISPIGFTGGSIAGLKLSEALKFGQGALKGRTLFGSMARGAMTDIGGAIGAQGLGSTALAIEEGRPVLREVTKGVAFGAGSAAAVNVAIPLGFAGLAKIVRGIRAVRGKSPGNFNEEYVALEHAFFRAKEEGRSTLPGLTESEFNLARKNAASVGMPLEDYGEFLDELAVRKEVFPELFDEHLDQALYAYARRKGTIPAVPIVSRPGERLAEYAALEPIPNDLKEKHLFPKWLRSITGKAAEAFGIAPEEAHYWARNLLTEHYGQRKHFNDQALRDLHVRWTTIPQGERKRAGEILHGMLEEFPVEAQIETKRLHALKSRVDELNREIGNTVEIKRQGFKSEVQPTYDIQKEGKIYSDRLRRLHADLKQAEDTYRRELKDYGAKWRQKGQIDFEAEIAALRKDPILSKPGRDTALLFRLLTNDMEDMIEKEGIGHVWGQGIYRNRAWILKEVKDVAEREADDLRIYDPVEFGVKGAAKLSREVPILEIDQRMGGAWWVRDGKGKILARYFSPEDAELAIELARKKGKQFEVVNPILWRDAVEGTTEMGKLVVEPGLTDAVRYVELANDLVMTRTLRDIARNPSLTRDGIKGQKPPLGWSAVADDPQKFGDLAGKWIRQNVADHVQDILSFDVKWLAPLMRGWSWARLGMNSGTHARNMIYDMVLLNHPSIGLSPFRAASFLSDAAEEYASNGGVFKMAVRLGVIGGEHTETVGKLFRENLKKLSESGDHRGAFALLENLKEGWSQSSKIYGAEDQIFALAGFLKLVRENGLTPAAAAAKVKEAFSDYRVMPRRWPVPFARQGPRIGQFPQNPFIRFDVDQARVWSNAARQGLPGMLWFAKWFGVYPTVMTSASLLLTGTSLDEFMEMQRFKPKWRAGDFMGVLLPMIFKDKDGKKKYGTMNWASPFPFIGARTDIRLDEVAEQEDLNFWQKAGLALPGRIFSHPVLTAIWSASTGINPFSGRPIAQPGESDVTAKAREVLGQTMPLPNWAMPSTYMDRKWRAAWEEVPAGGRIPRAQNLREFIPRAAGISYMEADPLLERQQFDQSTAREVDKIIREEYVPLAVQRENKQISDETYRKREAFILEKLERIETRSREGRPSSPEKILRLLGIKPAKEK